MSNYVNVYVHIPFCAKKCFYCDFFSYPDKEQMIDQYVLALKEEIKTKANEFRDYCIKTIYIGGGTPSYIDSKLIVEIMQFIRNEYNVDKDAEITIEINPGTVTKEKIEDYKLAKINRLSIGLQSTNNELLNKIGRIHNLEQFFDTYKYAKECGFYNINIDLMIGLPNQSIKDIKKDLEIIVDLNPSHISVYSLILEEETKLYNDVKKKKLLLPEEELERNMYWYVKNTLELSEYNHYEISNFSKKGYESKHNLDCWDQKEYIGFGLGAHSYFQTKRYSNIIDIEEYIRNCTNHKLENNIILNEVLLKEEMQKEYMLLALRKIEGVSILLFKNRFIENPIYIFKDELNKLINKELLMIQGDNIRLTNKGLDFANIVWEEFI